MSKNKLPERIGETERYEIEERLKKLHPKKAVVFAHRCALRAVPILAHDPEFGYWKENKRNDFLMEILRCFDFSYAYNAAAAAAAATSTSAVSVFAGATAAAEAAAVVNSAYLARSASAAFAVHSAAAARGACTAAAAAFIENKMTTDVFRAKIISAIYQDLEILERGETLPALREEGHPFLERFLKALADRGMSYWAEMFLEHWEDRVDYAELKNRMELPNEVLEAGEAAVVEYLNSKSGKQKKFNEIKAVFIGEGGAGKTALVRKINNRRAEMPKQEEKTEGVEVTEKEFSDNETRVRIWDFGGQVIYHAAHQLFMTERTVYVVVIDERRENDPDYWLRHAETFGGNSPVMVVINKWDVHQNGIAEKTLKEKFPAIKGIYRISSKYPDRYEFGKFLKDFERLCVGNISWGREYAAEWVAVKEELTNLEQPFITYGNYLDICRKHNILEAKTQQSLLEILKNLGVVLYYPEAGQENQVLDPEWISRGIYRILSSDICREQKGEVKLSQLKLILWSDKPEEEKFNQEEYPERLHLFLLKVASIYELCYFKDKNTAIFPDRLQEDYPDDVVFPGKDEEAICLRYEFNFLPRVVFTRFLSRIHSNIQSAKLWRRGGVLHHGKYGNTAHIRVDYESKTMEVNVTGGRRAEFLQIIMKHMADISESYREFHFYKQVPVGRKAHGEMVWGDLDELKELVEEGEVVRKFAGIPEKVNLTEVVDVYKENAERQERMHKDTMEAIRNVGTKVITASANAASNVKTDVRTDVKVEIDIQIKNESVRLASGEMDYLIEEIEEEMPDEEKLIKQLKKYRKALGEIGKAETKEEAQSKGAFNRLKHFVEDMAEKGSKFHGALEKIDKGWETFSGFARNYNNVAQWCGLPIVPEPLLKKKD